jgi:AAA ATPase domain
MSKHALSAESDLLERDAELAAVEDLISTTPSVGRLLTIEGPPGIGKTSLLVEAKARGQAAGMQVVAARGSELERTFSYGVVRQLFEPLLARLPVEERAEALDGAAVLALPLFDPAQLAAPPAADSSLATLHGLYWLTANVAARRPLLLAVDDLHWCDLPSLRWLAYVLPRMEGLGVSIVVSLRTGEPGEDPNLLVQIVSDPLATVIRPAPLSTRAAARFVRQALSSDADDAFCAACHEETGGNPLLLRELMHAIAAEGLAPTQQNVPRLRELGAGTGPRASRFAFPASRRDQGNLHRLSRSWATTPIPSTRQPWRNWTDKLFPRQRARSHGSTSCAPSRRSGSCTHSSAPPSTRRSHLMSEASDMRARPVSSTTRGPSPNGSPRTCCSLPRPRIQGSWQRCAKPRAARRLAARPRPQWHTFSARSPSRLPPHSVPSCCSNSGLPRRSSAATLRAGHLFWIPATPHDSWVIGDQPYVSLHFLGADHYAAQRP